MHTKLHAVRILLLKVPLRNIPVFLRSPMSIDSIYAYSASKSLQYLPCYHFCIVYNKPEIDFCFFLCSTSIIGMTIRGTCLCCPVLIQFHSFQWAVCSLYHSCVVEPLYRSVFLSDFMLRFGLSQRPFFCQSIIFLVYTIKG